MFSQDQMSSQIQLESDEIANLFKKISQRIVEYFWGGGCDFI